MNVKVIKTKRNSTPMQSVADFSFAETPKTERQLINVYPHIEYQTVNGFGGAFTEAASTTLDKLDAEKLQDKKPHELLAAVARKRGFLISGGELDTERASAIVLDEFRSSKIGRISLEGPEVLTAPRAEAEAEGE